MKLSKIIKVIDSARVKNFSEKEIETIAYDSREVTNGTLFFALHGEKTDGHQFLKDAIERGADACVVENDTEITAVPVILVADARKELAVVSSHFFAFPSKKLTVIGVTGTNGKTTTTFLIKHIFDCAGMKAGLIGTLGCFIDKTKIDLPNTTPESLWLQRIMRTMVDSCIEVCVMEVSSHGIAMGRISTIDFDVGILTNISRDHLDFHKTFNDYVQTKLLFFKGLKKEATAFINSDIQERDTFIQNVSSGCFTYGIREKADFTGEIRNINERGIEMTINHNGKRFRLMAPLRGRYNAYNVIPAFACSYHIGLSAKQIEHAIGSFRGVQGRGEKIDTGLGFTCVIDYAHTPDALFNLLTAERELTKRNLICVLGAGGDRDEGKRAEMGKTAASLCDRVILTSDNPRSEKPEAIINDIAKGINGKKVTIEIDRRKAIEVSIAMAQKGDTVIIAGKGHEMYQEIMGKRIPFSDREVAEDIIRKRKKGKDESKRFNI